MSDFLAKIRSKSKNILDKIQTKVEGQSGNTVANELSPKHFIANNAHKLPNGSLHQQTGITSRTFSKAYDTIRGSDAQYEKNELENLSKVIKVQDNLGKNKYITQQELFQSIITGKRNYLTMEHCADNEELMIAIPMTIKDLVQLTREGDLDKQEKAINKVMFHTSHTPVLKNRVGDTISALRSKINPNSVHTSLKNN
jgi:hypothetical protein